MTDDDASFRDREQVGSGGWRARARTRVAGARRSCLHGSVQHERNGDIAVVGNTLETCQSSVADCANARAGTGSALNNNNFSMMRVNVDPAALDSSSARLNLPAGARVLFAGLYYGGRTTAGTGGKAAPDASAAGLSRVDLK